MPSTNIKTAIRVIALLLLPVLGLNQALGFELTEFAISYKPTSVKKSVASKKAMDPDGSALNLAFGFNIKNNWIGEAGWDIFNFDSSKSLSGGTDWHETSRVGNISYGYPISAKSTSIRAHGIHTQAGYRYSLTEQKDRGFVACVDVSGGYLALFKVTRESGSSGTYTNQISEEMSLKSGAYIQPRITIAWENRGFAMGLQGSIEQYIGSDLDRSWTIGLVFGDKF